MSECLQYEIDPIKITESVLGGVLVAVDIITFSQDEYPKDTSYPICLIAAAHTRGLSIASKVYTRLFIANMATVSEEKSIIMGFASYLDTFNGGTLAAHYGACTSLDDGFDIPYLLLRTRDQHPEMYAGLTRSLARFRYHDTCQYAKEKMNLPSAELDYVESYFSLARKPEAQMDGDVRAGMAEYWKSGDTSVLRYGLTNVYNCLRIAQSQIRKSMCCTDIPL